MKKENIYFWVGLLIGFGVGALFLYAIQQIIWVFLNNSITILAKIQLLQQ